MAMIVIPRRVPWRRKPPNPRIDWSNPINDGLVGWWLFFEGAGSQLFDLVGNSNGSLVNFPANPWLAEGGLTFDGSNDEVNCGTHQSIQLDDLTVIAEFVWENGASGFEPLISRYNTSTNQRSWWIGVDSTNSWAFYNSSDGVSNSGDLARFSATNGAREVVAFVKSGVNVTSYKNRSSQNSSSLANANQHDSTEQLKIGGYNGGNFKGKVYWIRLFNKGLDEQKIFTIVDDYLVGLLPRRQLIFIPSGGALSLSSAATLRDGDKPIATQQKSVSVDALIRAADLLIGTPQKSISVDALLADADKLSTASRHEATLAAQLLDGDVSIAPARKAGSISGLLRDSDKATGVSSKAALVTGLLLDGDLLTALGSQAEAHQSAGVLSGADVLIAGVTTNRTTAGKSQDGDTLTVASAIDRLSAALGIDPETLTGAATSARSIGALIVEGDAAIAGIQSGRLQPALLIDGDILIIASSTVAQADLAGRINLSGRYAPQVSLVGVYAPAINLKGRVH